MKLPAPTAETAEICALVIGAALVVAGVAMIYRPAGLIVAGSFLLVTAWLHARSAAAAG